MQFTPVKSAAYAKLHQRASHFAIVGVAAALEVENGTIQSARIGLTGASSHATRLTDVEEALAGKPLSASSIEAAARLAGASLQDINSDIHASEEYRRAMIPVFTGRALKRALDARQPKRRSPASPSGTRRIDPCIIFATPPISRWPTRAIGPPVCTAPLTSTAVDAPSGRSAIDRAAFHESGRPCPSTTRRYEVWRVLSVRSTVPL